MNSRGEILQVRIGHDHAEDLDPTIIFAQGNKPHFLWWNCASEQYEFAFTNDFFCWKNTKTSEVKFLHIPRGAFHKLHIVPTVLEELEKLCGRDENGNQFGSLAFTSMTIDACNPYEAARASQSGLIDESTLRELGNRLQVTLNDRVFIFQLV